MHGAPFENEIAWRMENIHCSHQISNYTEHTFLENMAEQFKRNLDGHQYIKIFLFAVMLVSVLVLSNFFCL